MMTEGKQWLSGRLQKIQRLEGYSPDETVEEIAMRLGIDSSEVVKLNANENLFIPKETLLEFMKEIAEEWDPRIYPQEEERRLKEGLANYLDVSPRQIVVGNGSDELIQQIAQLFLGDQDQALSVKPTFSMYGHCVRTCGAEYVEVPLRSDFSMDSDQLSRAITSRSRILFLCSPNNPTANQFGLSEVRSLVRKFPGLVLVDEAYVEFGVGSLLPHLNEMGNLAILRTFSKAYGLAGLRLGYLVANPEFAETLSVKVQSPFPVSSLALRMGSKMLANIRVVERAVEQLKVEREKLIRRLNEIKGIQAFDSQTNFVLFQVESQSDRVHRLLASKGILVKNLGKILHLRNCLRATVGLTQMNALLLNGLKEALGEKLPISA